MDFLNFKTKIDNKNKTIIVIQMNKNGESSLAEQLYEKGAQATLKKGEKDKIRKLKTIDSNSCTAEEVPISPETIKLQTQSGITLLLTRAKTMGKITAVILEPNFKKLKQRRHIEKADLTAGLYDRNLTVSENEESSEKASIAVVEIESSGY